MGKRSDFERHPRDFYPTPVEAVYPLLRFLPTQSFCYIEPCAGDGTLINHLASLVPWANCIGAFDIAPGGQRISVGDATQYKRRWQVRSSMPVMFITNPPWERKTLHAIIENLRRQAMTWLLIDAAWMFTKQAVPHLRFCADIVNVGRLKWIPGTDMAGKDDCCWYRFQEAEVSAPRYWPKEI